MKIYTGYYAKMRLYRQAGLIPIAISRSTPSNIGVNFYFQELAPSSELLSAYKSGVCTDEQYVARYTRETLSNLSITNFLEKLRNIDRDGNFVLLCYEKSGSFCHRNILASHLRNNGILVEEFRY